MTSLEAKLIRDVKAGRTVSLERGLLIVSGLETEEEIGQYSRKLDLIQHRFTERLESKSGLSLSTLRKYLDGSRARFLFEYLWSTKPRRCDSNFLLTDVVDAQLNTDVDQKVGSCVGLTSLYTVLGLREGLDLTILVSGSHILNRLRVGKDTYSVDNTDPLGFDCELSGRNFFEYPAIGLLANVFNSRGIAKEGIDDLKGAEEDYNAAIELNPRYANAYNNRGNVKLKEGDYTGAIEDYSRAIQLNPALVEAYCNRGIAKESVEDHRGAAEDYDEAIGIDSGYIDAYWRRGKLKQALADYIGAVSDLERVIELDPESRENMIRLINDIKYLWEKLIPKQINYNGG